MLPISTDTQIACEAVTNYGDNLNKKLQFLSVFVRSVPYFLKTDKIERTKTDKNKHDPPPQPRVRQCSELFFFKLFKMWWIKSSGESLIRLKPDSKGTICTVLYDLNCV